MKKRICRKREECYMREKKEKTGKYTEARRRRRGKNGSWGGGGEVV
jgi:hypothetical protein